MQPDTVSPVTHLYGEDQLLFAEVHALCERNELMLIDYNPDAVRIAAAQQPRRDVVSAIRFLAGKRVEIELWHSEKLAYCRQNTPLPEPVLFPGVSPVPGSPANRHRSQPASVVPLSSTAGSPSAEPASRPDADYYPAEQQSAAVRFVNQLVTHAIAKRASDIHIEPIQQGYRIRARIDGQLHTLNSPPPEISSEISIRLKIIAGLDIAEKRLPQDGQFEWLERDIRYAVRIATLPTIYGEKIVLRLLSTSQNLALEKSGLTTAQLTTLHTQLNGSQGIILLTGPTGSGKTATLYGCLQYLNQNNRNICSVEDPVEIPLRGITQTQINPKIELGFATILRALLRQDPDVIMVGEIRDKATAEMAIKAAHTGHLVLSTLHTNSPEDTFSRLQQLGVDDYFIRTCIKLVIAQRLVRILCPHCKTPASKPVPVTLHNGKIRNITVWQANGCTECFSGFYGRTACFAFLTPEDCPPARGATLYAREPECTEKISSAPGTIPDTLFDAGIKLAEAGVTTLSEIHYMQDI
ncbi:ATPase, T2SS/T4P/T4SS family [Morganella psychrotolerans]|uniref:Pilus assembly protein PilB n=1 Tax=Morganella psychrotolerans TaxID=368603 RepID=A0A1B8GYY9_9GAMM|nr:ATPase, T2SS/T4P/T4SS family [Morganella psychrotolerans]OBU02038.1 pilus assembly protein PilB [Morganella psychrotolerans]